MYCKADQHVENYNFIFFFLFLILSFTGFIKPDQVLSKDSIVFFYFNTCVKVSLKMSVLNYFLASYSLYF